MTTQGYAYGKFTTASRTFNLFTLHLRSRAECAIALHECCQFKSNASLILTYVSTILFKKPAVKVILGRTTRIIVNSNRNINLSAQKKLNEMPQGRNFNEEIFILTPGIVLLKLCNYTHKSIGSKY